MDIDYQVGEVELSYKSTVREKRKIATSSDAYGMLLSTFRDNSFIYKYNIFFRKYELSTVIFTSIIKKLFRFFSMSY